MDIPYGASRKGADRGEPVRKNVKHDRIGRAGVVSASDLIEEVARALERLHPVPGIVRGFFRHLKPGYTFT